MAEIKQIRIEGTNYDIESTPVRASLNNHLNAHNVLSDADVAGQLAFVFTEQSDGTYGSPYYFEKWNWPTGSECYLGSLSKPFDRVYANNFYGAFYGNATSADKVNNKLTFNITCNSGSASSAFIEEYDGSSALNLDLDFAAGNHTHSNYSLTSHTHKYAGSSSAGGSATSAVKLDTSTAGDSNTPVYFSGGKPVACTALDLNTTGTAAAWTTARTLTLTGAVTGSVSIKGNAAMSLATTKNHEHNRLYYGSDSSNPGVVWVLDGGYYFRPNVQESERSVNINLGSPSYPWDRVSVQQIYFPSSVEDPSITYYSGKAINFGYESGSTLTNGMWYNYTDGLEVDGKITCSKLYITNPGTTTTTSTTSTTYPLMRYGVSSTQVLYYKASSSSQRFKENITQNFKDELKPENLYNAKVYQYNYKDGHLDSEDLRANKDLIGFIVEDLIKQYPIAVNLDEFGLPDSWEPAYMIPPMLKLIQDQKKEIEELKSDLSSIKEILSKNNLT